MDRRLMFGIPAVVTAILLVTTVVISVNSLIGNDEGILLIGFDHEMAGEHVRNLVQWGPRMTGSEAESLGADYISRQFEDAGLQDVHIETFQVPMFEVVTAELSLVEYYPLKNVPRPFGQTVQFTHMEEFVIQGYSGSLASSDFRGDLEVVDIGNGTDPGSYSRSRGMVCFIEQTVDTPGNVVVYENAFSAGASAIILQNLMRGEEIGYLPMFKTSQYHEPEQAARDIPFMMVSKDCGDEILQRTSGSFKLRMDIEVRTGNMDCRVVVGDLKGKSDDGMIVFGAHHDTCYNTIGAVDNTVGPATLIEIARGMNGRTPKSTIRFATFGGEEEGLYGSIEYYKAHRAEFQDTVDLYINFDMAHVDPDTNSFTVTTTRNSTIPVLEDIRDKLLRKDPTLSRYEISVVYDDMRWAASDHWPFVNGGHHAMGGWGSGCIEYHTYKDDLTNLNPESLQIGGRILGSYALMTAS
ncbi:MAG: M28 family peptidase [Candidatus Thermoplasmatota archaeon]|nr:M28 family peptidase [Candidatus Thermoplasmatota archaeon]